MTSPPTDTEHDGDDIEPGRELPELTRLHKILIGIVVAGAIIIAGIGFSGSFTAVKELAERKGFGEFAPWLPIGVDAGILVCLALDLLLTWIRMPFPLLRQTAWVLTTSTIAFNAAAAWPDPLAVGMHAVIPVLFIVAVEAARHAIGRIADITADKHMDGVRFSRWLLSPLPTFRLWRRMKLWEIRSYEAVVSMEQDRLVYEARLRAHFGRGWRRKAPVNAMTPLRLARYGVPLAQTGTAGLKAAGIEAVLPFADNRTDSQADNRTALAGRTSGRRELMSAPADNRADKPGADNDGPDNRAADEVADNETGRGMSARTSAPEPSRIGVVRADNTGQPHGGASSQATAGDSRAVVRPDSAVRPLPVARTAGLVRPDNAPANTSADNGADKHADNADNHGADTGRPDKSADNRPHAADNGADNTGAEDVPVVRTGRRGEVSDGVRAQLAAGVNNPREIAQHLTEALGREVTPANVGRIVRREQEKKRDTYAGQYL